MISSYAIYTPSFRVWLDKEGKIRAIVIKKRLELLANKVAGPDLITNVLVQSITDTSPSNKKSEPKG